MSEDGLIVVAVDELTSARTFFTATLRPSDSCSAR